MIASLVKKSALALGHKRQLYIQGGWASSPGSQCPHRVKGGKGTSDRKILISSPSGFSFPSHQTVSASVSKGKNLCLGVRKVGEIPGVAAVDSAWQESVPLQKARGQKAPRTHPSSNRSLSELAALCSARWLWPAGFAFARMYLSLGMDKQLASLVLTLWHSE